MTMVSLQSSEWFLKRSFIQTPLEMWIFPVLRGHRKHSRVAVCLGLGVRAVEENVSYASRFSISVKMAAWDHPSSQGCHQLGSGHVSWLLYESFLGMGKYRVCRGPWLPKDSAVEMGHIHINVVALLCTPAVGWAAPSNTTLWVRMNLNVSLHSWRPAAALHAGMNVITSLCQLSSEANCMLTKQFKLWVQECLNHLLLTLNQ